MKCALLDVGACRSPMCLSADWSLPCSLFFFFFFFITLFNLFLHTKDESCGKNLFFSCVGGEAVNIFQHICFICRSEDTWESSRRKAYRCWRHRCFLLAADTCGVPADTAQSAGHTAVILFSNRPFE